jgi:hypothetical protein
MLCVGGAEASCTSVSIRVFIFYRRNLQEATLDSFKSIGPMSKALRPCRTTSLLVGYSMSSSHRLIVRDN